MILNAYAVFVGFMALLRIPLGLLVLRLAIPLWRQSDQRLPVDDRQEWEDRTYLAMLASLVLLGLNLAAWPIFYALLQSYVPQWPGVMCIYGVTRIGLGSGGASGYLPSIVASLQVFKPLVVFTSGAWFTLHVIDRRSMSSTLAGPVVLGIALFGGLSLVDAVMELTYLAIPKSEQFLEAGCCALMLDNADRTVEWLPSSWLTSEHSGWLATMFFGGHALLAAALMVPRRWGLESLGSTAAASGFVLIAAFLAVPGYYFLMEVAAPAILRLPYHHCLYDLLPRAPETVFGLGLLAGGELCVGWAAIARGIGSNYDAEDAAPQVAQRLQFLAGCSFAGALLLLAVEIALT